MQMGFYFDQTRCTGCLACVIACKQWHEVPPGPAKWRRVITTERGKYPNVTVTFLSVACCHCAEPACVEACPVGAIIKRNEDGIVVVNREKCLGKDSCMLCWDACPYGAPQFRAEDNAEMEKCNFCFERLAENRKPICVEACITRALDAGPIEQLQAKYNAISEAEGFTYSQNLKPSVLFKPKCKCK